MLYSLSLDGWGLGYSGLQDILTHVSAISPRHQALLTSVLVCKSSEELEEVSVLGRRSLAFMNCDESTPGTMMKEASSGGGDSGIVYGDVKLYVGIISNYFTSVRWICNTERKA